jgi:hypothetical protein
LPPRQSGERAGARFRMIADGQRIIGSMTRPASKIPKPWPRIWALRPACINRARLIDQATGTTSLQGISDALNKQGIRTARGKRWYVSSVANLLARAKVLVEASR